MEKKVRLQVAALFEGRALFDNSVLTFEVSALFQVVVDCAF